MSEESKNIKKGFLDLLKREFTVNDFMDKYGQGGYASSPNIPYEIPKTPDTHQSSPWYQPYQPYQQPWNTPQFPQYDPLRKTIEDQLTEALRAFEEEQRREQARRQQTERQIEDHIARMFGNEKIIKQNEKKDVFKAAFIQLISDRIEFDENGNIVDEDGFPIKSIGAFGLLFMRILNSVLESKKSADEIEKDLKKILKSE